MNKKGFRIISFTIFLIVMIGITAIAIPFLNSFKNPEEFKDFINGFGEWGFLIVLCIQIVQVLVAFIPGELVEFISGTLYGWFGGLLLCLLGFATGQTIIYKLVKFFGRNFIDSVTDSKTMNRLKFLQNNKKLSLVVFLLFFIPGTPKDLITYAIPLTPMKLRDFLVISLIARIPSVLSSTYAGSLFIKRDFKMLIVTYAIIIVISAIGVVAYKIFESKHSKKDNSPL